MGEAVKDPWSVTIILAAKTIPDIVSRESPKKNCEWIKNKKPEKCAKKSVSKSCPVSCNACCKDDPNFSFKGNSAKDCDWVKKKLDNGASVCNKKAGDTKVKISCPVACGNCQ